MRICSVQRFTMNIKVVCVVLIIGVLLWQIDASRSKSGRKKLFDRRNKSSFTSSDSADDDEDRRRKDHSSVHERIHDLSEQRDKKYGSSSSEESDKDGRNETAINLGNKIHRKRELELEKEQYVKQSLLLPWTKRNTRAGLLTTEERPQIQQNGRKLLIFPAEWNKKTLPEKPID
ncbi:unnamed protein product [Litomosoides sigmodontis]|uniref:Uncharacterized protein n=1 Tax=Litomosoides sigmodontis TaxID=42156 RepID=A0A3P6TZ62_LITSI|nr:unnamed protein product [Litomosoides sigmodontis]